MVRSAVPSRRLLVLLVATAVALMTIDARGFGPIQSLRGAVFAASQPVRSGITWVLSPVSNAWQGAVHYDELEDENALLRQQVAELEGEQARLPDTALELEQLLAATELEFVGDIPRVTARVVADRRTGLERIVEIDRGSNDGLEEGMPVVNGEGLVGRVQLVTSDRSVIRLLTDPRFSIGIVSRSTGALGVASGNGDGRELIVDLEAASLDLADDEDRFETSGFEQSRYPGGIPVGTLTVDEKRDRRTLQPGVDLERLPFVTILLVSEPR